MSSLDFPPDRRSLCVSEVAEALRVSLRHVMNLIEEGKIQAIDIGIGVHHHWRIPVDAYKEYIKKQSSIK